MGDQQLPGMPAPWPLRRHPHRRRPRGRRARRADAAVGVRRRRPGDAGPGHLLADRGQPLPGQDRRRRVRHPALPGVADPRPATAQHGARGLVHQMGRPPILSPARLRQARTCGGTGPDPRRDRPQAGRVPVPDHRADQAARHAARPRHPVRRHRRGTGAGQATRPPATARHRPRTARRHHRRRTRRPGDSPAPDTAGQQPGMPAPAREPAEARWPDRRPSGDEGRGSRSWRVARRIETGTVACRYAGAMLVHAFTGRIGARGLLSAGTGASAAGPGRAGRTTWASWCAPRCRSPSAR